MHQYCCSSIFLKVNSVGNFSMDSILVTNLLTFERKLSFMLFIRCEDCNILQHPLRSLCLIINGLGKFIHLEERNIVL